jgi:hypothetical protein
MLFAAPIVAAMAYDPLVALVVTKKGGKKSPAKGTMEPAEPAEPADGFDSNGLITSWRLASPEDTRLLKDLVVGGALIKQNGINMKPEEVKSQFPRFKRFNNSCLSTKISNLKRDYRDQVERRAASTFRHDLLVSSFFTSFSKVMFSFSCFFLQWRMLAVVAKASKLVTATASVLEMAMR